MAPVRLGAALILILVAGPGLGWATTLTWGAVVLALEAIDWPLSHDLGRRGEPTRFERLRMLAVSLAGNLAWLSFGILYWLHPPMGSAFIAALMWSALLLNAVGYAFRSATALWVYATPTVATIILAPMLWPRSTGPELTMSFIGALLCCGFALIAGWQNIQAARVLAQSQLDLEVERGRAEQ
eukprot:gene21441-21382_t